MPSLTISSALGQPLMTLLRRQAVSATFFADAETLYNDPYFAPFFRQAVLEGHEMGLLSKGTDHLKTCFPYDHIPP